MSGGRGEETEHEVPIVGKYKFGAMAWTSANYQRALTGQQDVVDADDVRIATRAAEQALTHLARVRAFHYLYDEDTVFPHTRVCLTALVERVLTTLGADVDRFHKLSRSVVDLEKEEEDK